ncbi:Scr1 family TA system antitoxin-like transcriptional regulator [Streptomyces sp. NPDC051642]|uniref:Scr1 family TA system antitoxin-like transcriptional regulator n=1 Tax=Streptomyces sp. NPDC051642 TaxID=3154646 RepID=UPI0034428F10
MDGRADGGGTGAGRPAVGGPRCDRDRLLVPCPYFLVQLNHLLSESERDNVTLLVIPFSAGDFPMAGDSVLYVAAGSPHLDTVQVDSPTGAVFFDAPAQLANFRRRMDAVEQGALNRSRSRDAILDIIKEL